MSCKKIVAAGAVLLCLLGAAHGQTGFQPATEVSPIAPPSNQSAMNAAQVILGMAQRYVVTVNSGPYERAATTTDFVNFALLPVADNVFKSTPVAVSDDGQRVVGTVWWSPSPVPGSGSVSRTAVWDGEIATTVKSFGSVFNQAPIGISTDGARWVVQTGVGGSERAYLYNAVDVTTTSVVPFPDDEQQLTTAATAVSPDGRWVAGSYNGPVGDTFVWSEATGGELLVRPYAARPFPLLVADGLARLVCRQIDALHAAPTYSRGVWRLIPTFTGAAMSRDGSMVLGTSSVNGRASYWSETTGVEDLGAALVARGINVLGWTLTTVDFISADARRIVGRGRAPGATVTRYWVATVEPFAAADVGKTGGVSGSDGRLDNNDLIVFIDRFFASDERADVGRVGGERGADGEFDNNDFCVFITLFFTGAS